jgi:alcohol dehydrogenase class IV
MATNEGSLEDYQWNNKPFANPPLPLIAVPTTAGTGSEVTGVAVITSRNAKKGIKKQEIFPKTAILDPELMLTMPPFLTATTGMDALTHAVEAYVGKNSNPVADSLAEAAIRLIGDNLAKAVENGSNIESRSNMALASTMAGIAMDQAGLGIVHSLSSPVCTFMHLSHGLANAVLLPFGMEYNLTTRPEYFAEIARLLGGDTSEMKREEAARLSVELVHRLIDRIGLGEELASIKNQFKKRNDLDTFGESASNIFLIRNNPKPASAAECTGIFRRIAEG